MHYLRGVDENGVRYTIADPRAEFCQALVADDTLLTQRLLGVEEIFGGRIGRDVEAAGSQEAARSTKDFDLVVDH